jgi:hypothetical protein
MRLKVLINTISIDPTIHRQLCPAMVSRLVVKDEFTSAPRDGHSAAKMYVWISSGHAKKKFFL